jgi:hypothetical protein
MDDFRVGSVPSSEPYGDRHPYGSVTRKRQKHRDGQSGQQQDDDADAFEGDAASPSAAAGGEIEDYYLPSDSRGDAE